MNCISSLFIVAQRSGGASYSFARREKKTRGTANPDAESGSIREFPESSYVISWRIGDERRRMGGGPDAGRRGAGERRRDKGRTRSPVLSHPGPILEVSTLTRIFVCLHNFSTLSSALSLFALLARIGFSLLRLVGIAPRDIYPPLSPVACSFATLGH